MTLLNAEKYTAKTVAHLATHRKAMKKSTADSSIFQALKFSQVFFVK